jgi:hypothetical protein
MDTFSDQTLLKQIKEGNQEALEALFDKYYYNLCDFAFQFVRSFDLTEYPSHQVHLFWKLNPG